MKLFFILSFCILHSALVSAQTFTRSVAFRGAARPTTVSAPTLVADIWQDFEFDTLSAANLDAHDHYSGGTWSLSASASTNMSMVADAEQATLSSINGTADTGTRGLMYSWSNSVPASISMTLPTTNMLVVASVWFRCPTPAASSWTGGEQLTIGTTVNGYCRVNLLREAGNPYIKLVGATTSGTISLTGGNKYWITVQAGSAQTCRLRAYDTDKALVGSEQTCTGTTTTNAFKITVGALNAPNAPVTFEEYDDLIVDLDGSTYPLGP